MKFDKTPNIELIETTPFTSYEFQAITLCISSVSMLCDFSVS